MIAWTGTPLSRAMAGRLVKVLDSCPEGIRSSGSFDYDVNQVDRSIVVDNNGNGTTFTGEVDDDNQGFLVTGNPIRTEGCTGIPGISFDDLDGDTASVTFLGVFGVVISNVELPLPAGACEGDVEGNPRYCFAITAPCQIEGEDNSRRFPKWRQHKCSNISISK